MFLTGKRICTIAWLLFFVSSPAFAVLDYPHFGVNNIGCDSCHFIYGTEPTLLPPWTAHTPQNIDDTQHNTLCWSCHNDVDAPYVRTHSSLQIDNSYGNWTVECRVCHNPHYQKQFRTYGSASYLYSGTSTGITTSTITETDAGWTDNEYQGLVVVPNVSQKNYNYKILGNTSDTLTVDGPIDLTKVTVGNTFAIVYGKLIYNSIDLSRISIDPSKSGNKTVRFYNSAGTNSFADGNSTYDGVCEVCHTQTTHFRNGAYGSDPTYTNPLHTNVGSPAGTNCTPCHSHVYGFRHGGGEGSGCDDCHGHDAGYGGVTGGKGTYVAHSTHTENDTDDKRGPNAGCSTCHNTSSFPNFADGVSYADYKAGTAMTTVCNPCHSPNGTYNGVSDAVVGAKNSWSLSASSDSRIYNTDGSLKTGKEKWCATCHDEEPSQIQSVNAPNVIGDEDNSDGYGTYGPWGFYKTGHGLPLSQTYPASGGMTAGGGKECLDCHDSTTSHIDGNTRTFDCGNGCDSTEYRQSYRLKLIGGQEPMFMPWPVNNSNDATRYRLCVSCHNSGPFLNSMDMNTNFVTESINRHNSHLIMNNVYFPADYNYGAGYNSRITCVICHNVHGSTRLAMVRDGKLINREPGMKIWYRNDDIVFWSTSSPNPPVPENLPLSASTGTIIQYSTTPNLCGVCHSTDNLVGESRAPFQNVSQAPTLAWTGEILYTSDGVNPDSAVSGSTFTFRVKYTDLNNDAPTVYQVWIDKNDINGYEFDEKFDMTAVNVADVNYVDGKIYKYSLPLTTSGDNTFNYCFTFSDGSAATGVPACGTNHQVTITNNVPTLSWTEEKYFENDGVNPDIGGDGSSFTFHVKYTDADNECPASGSSNIQLWLDVNDNGAYDPGEEFNMTEVDAGDTNCTAGGGGKLYTTTRAISYAGDGDLRYRFYASDGTDSATGSSTYDSIVAVLSSANTPPTLAWTTADCLTNGVRPATGATGADFEFRVEYTDANNQAPSVVQVLIDLNDDGDYDDANETNTMTIDGGDGNYTNGEVYKYSVAINYAGDGTLKYKFAASDGTNAATGEPVSEEKTFTIVNTTYKVRPAGGSGWYSTIADALAASPASSTVLVYPNADFTAATYTGGLWDVNKTDRTLQSVCGADFTFINGNSATQAVYLAGNDGALIDGFSITGGASYGIYANIDSFTLKNSKVYSNPIGIWMNNGCNPVNIDNSSIYDNASYGINSPSGSNLLSITDSSIYNNGGGATNGAGISFNSGAGTHTITGSSLTGNTTTGNGGAIYCNNCAINIDDSTFNNNTAGAGGAIYFLNSAVNATITDTFIQGNESTSGLGGAIYMGSGAESLTNVMLTGNKAATNGGAIYINAGTTDCLFCTISGNYAGGYAGALYQNSSSQTTIKNSVIYNNDAVSGGNFKQIFASSPRYDYVDVYYTLINQSPGSTNSGPPDQRCSYEDKGGNDTSNAPFFEDGLEPSTAPTANGDYRLQSYSYSINAASATWTSDHDIYGGPRPSSGAYDMGADESASGNNAPTLSWTGETNYTSDGVNANSGIGGSSFEFRIDYTDADNNAPTVIQVWVDTDDNGSYEAGEKYTMTEVDGGDTTYTDGKRYTKTMTIYYAGNGNIRYRFYAYDGYSAAVGAPTTHSMVNITNNVPILDWTGETNYTTDGVNPDSGINGSSFTFRVKYTDADNNAPSPMQLYIDLNDDGDYNDANEINTMTIDGGDGDYRNGEIFTKTLTVNHPGGASDGVLSYKFYASDGTNDATGSPASPSTVTVTNSAPTLNWVGSGGYTNDGADPDSGPNGTSFTFRVVYTDTDNNAPSPIKLYIDLNDDGDYNDTNEQQTMVDTVGGDGNYANGETFTKTLVLNHPGSGDGILNYHFYASDGTATATGAPTSDKTVTIAGSNNPPTLDWTTADCLTSGGVRPATGAAGANFEFRVKYTDQDNNPPSPIQVYIDLNDDGNYDDPNEINTMTIDGGDGDYTNGEIFQYSVAIPYTGDGILKYKFSASDGTDAATGAPTGELTLTVVNTSLAVRPSGGTYNTIQAAINASSDPSTILVYPNADFTAATYASFVISTAVATKSNRTIQSVCGANSTIVSGGTDVVSSTNGNGNSVDGFSITGGSSRGVYMSCNVTQNFTLKNSGVYSNTAAGVFAAAACQLDVQNTDIYSNTGGGIYMQNNTSRLTVSDSEIYSNSGVANGAGINIGSGSSGTTHTITNTTIRNNIASSYGGGIYCNVCTFDIQDSIINNNEATSYFGGALYCTNTCTLTFDDCTINGNKSTAGGAFYFNSNTSAVTITDTFIQGNEATSSGGGAMFVNAGYANMTNVMLTGNRSAGRGGAIYMNNGYTNCTFCTISGNYSATQGGGIYLLNNYTSSLKNSIVYGNDAGSPTDANYKQIETNYRWTYMDVYNTLINQSPGSGTGNPRLSYEDLGGNLTASNPNFVMPIANPSTDTPTPNGDFRIQTGSPAVNAGSASYTADHDILGGPRPLGGGYDMGAHEKE